MLFRSGRPLDAEQHLLSLYTYISRKRQGHKCRYCSSCIILFVVVDTAVILALLHALGLDGHSAAWMCGAATATARRAEKPRVSFISMAVVMLIY